MKILFATHNKNKIKELKELLENSNYQVLSLFDLNDYKEIEETGNSFSENSLIKATNIALKYNMITIADDSGLEVESLNNEPGIYSARYSSLGDKANNELVLNKLTNITNRKARFVCSLSIVFPNKEYHQFEGTLDGVISEVEEGLDGFGYDPIFIPNGYNKTLATLGSKVKSKISHRANALKQLVQYIEKTSIK